MTSLPFARLSLLGGGIFLDGTSLTTLDAMGSLGDALNGSLVLKKNSALTSARGIDHLKTVGGHLEIMYNDALEDLDLSALQE